MITLTIPEMNCGHCKATVEKAVASVDAGAKVQVDLPARKVQVETAAPASALIAALDAVGFEARAA